MLISLGCIKISLNAAMTKMDRKSSSHGMLTPRRYKAEQRWLFLPSHALRYNSKLLGLAFHSYSYANSYIMDCADWWKVQPTCQFFFANCQSREPVHRWNVALWMITWTCPLLTYTFPCPEQSTWHVRCRLYLLTRSSNFLGQRLQQEPALLIRTCHRIAL